MDYLQLKRASSGEGISCSSSPLLEAGTSELREPFDAVDRLLETLLALPSSSVDDSLEKLIEARITQSKKELVVERALRLGSTLADAAYRSARKLATKHNAESWTLPADLTVKVFSMLDTQSLCHVAATCSLFNKFASDSSCYANINLTSSVPKVDNAVVYAMVQRAGKSLKSLKLGILRSQHPESSPEMPRCKSLVRKEMNQKQGKEWPTLTRSCLFCLALRDGLAGSLLRSLHLYNIDTMDGLALGAALSACRSLVDIKVVSVRIELGQTLELIYSNCQLIECLSLESPETGRDETLKSTTCLEFVNACPHLTSLSLKGFKLHDHKVRILMKGFRRLRYVDFSTSYAITGSFLRNLGGAGNLLEVLLLRDCLHLKEAEVSRLLASLLAGDFKFLRTLDISNEDGLAAEDVWYPRCYSMRNLPLARLEEERPGVVIRADFPESERYEDVAQMMDDSDCMVLSEPFGLGTSSSGSEVGSWSEGNFLSFAESSDEFDYM